MRLAADIGAGIKDAGCQSALLFGEPFGYGLHGCRETASFSKAQEKTRGRELKYGSRSRVSHGRDAPDENCQREALAGTHPVDQLSDKQHARPIGELENEDDIAVIHIGPAELDLQRWLEQGDHLPVHIIHGGSKKQQGTDQPASATAKAPELI